MQDIRPRGSAREYIEADGKVKCIGNEATQTRLAETIGTTGRYVKREG